MKGLTPHQQGDLHSHWDTFTLGYQRGCVVSRHLQAITQLAAGPRVARHGMVWVACLGTLLGVDAQWKELPAVSTTPFYGCLSWQIPNGKEELTGFLLPAFNGSVVAESPARGLTVMLPLGRFYQMFLFFKLLPYIQLRCMARSDFMADVMFMSKIFLCVTEKGGL